MLVFVRIGLAAFRLVAEPKLARELGQRAGVRGDFGAETVQFKTLERPCHQAEAQRAFVCQLVVEEDEVAAPVCAWDNIPYVNDTYDVGITPDPPEHAGALGHGVVELGEMRSCDGAAGRVVPKVIWKPRAMRIAGFDNLVDDVGRGGYKRFSAEGHISLPTG